MSSTVFKCSRCGYQSEILYLFKRHLGRKHECKPKESDISLMDVKQQFEMQMSTHNQMNGSPPSDADAEKSFTHQTIIGPLCDGETSKRSQSPTTPERRKKKKKLRCFGQESRDHLKRESLNEFIHDPLKGIQAVIRDIYFNKDHEENHTIRSIRGEYDSLEIHQNDVWVKADKTKLYDMMIYRATDILENSTLKKNWTEEFRNFIEGMGEMDNECLLVLIREETDDTIMHSEIELKKQRVA